MKSSSILFHLVFFFLISIVPAAGLSAQPDDKKDEEKTIVVLGSSVAAGWVTSFESRYDMKHGYAGRLERLLLSRGYRVKNISVPGDNTAKVLARMEKDLASVDPDFVIIGLSLGNEGIEGENPGAAFDSFRKGVREIIARCRKRGIIPIVGSCYSCNTYKDVHYGFTKKMNLLINTWGVPSINFLGAVDDGSGHIPQGFSYDHSHPDNLGHEQMFLAMVPGLFEALKQGKALPARTSGTKFVTVGSGSGKAPLSFIPDDVIHSFAVVFSIRTGSRGTVCTILTRDGVVRLDVGEDGGLDCSSSGGASLDVQDRIADGRWHDIALSHRYLSREILLFVDGEPVGSLDGRLEPIHFVLGGGSDRQLEKADFRDWMIYRSSLNDADIRNLHEGRLLQASLEVYAPLAGEKLNRNRLIENLAQSSSRVYACPSGTEKAIEAIREKLDLADAERRSTPVFSEKKPIEVHHEIYDSYEGKYSLAPGVALEIRKKENRLYLIDPTGGKTELFPESETRFFIKFPLAEVTVTFVRSGKNEVTHLVINTDGREDRAEKTD